MQKFATIFGIVLLLAVAIGNRTSTLQTAQLEDTTVELYFVDKSMLRLLEFDFDVGQVSRQKAAERVLAELVQGRDDNEKILRLIPNVKNCMTVKVDENVARVDIKETLVEQFETDSRQQELLLVYSVVNSLASIDGIDNVQFTVCGEKVRDFKGFLDMRETFIPDYYI